MQTMTEWIKYQRKDPKHKQSRDLIAHSFWTLEWTVRKQLLLNIHIIDCKLFMSR